MPVYQHFRHHMMGQIVCLVCNSFQYIGLHFSWQTNLKWWGARKLREAKKKGMQDSNKNNGQKWEDKRKGRKNVKNVKTETHPNNIWFRKTPAGVEWNTHFCHIQKASPRQISCLIKQFAQSSSWTLCSSGATVAFTLSIVLRRSTINKQHTFSESGKWERNRWAFQRCLMSVHARESGWDGTFKLCNSHFEEPSKCPKIYWRRKWTPNKFSGISPVSLLVLI